MKKVAVTEPDQRVELTVEKAVLPKNVCQNVTLPATLLDLPAPVYERMPIHKYNRSVMLLPSEPPIYHLQT